MTEGIAMKELREIKTLNSLEHIEMTTEELLKDLQKTSKYFLDEKRKDGKEIKVINI